MTKLRVKLDLRGSGQEIVLVWLHDADGWRHMYKEALLTKPGKKHYKVRHKAVVGRQQYQSYCTSSQGLFQLHGIYKFKLLSKQTF